MKKLLKSKKGVTILEGLIALLLLAMISVGTFGVLLSTSRKSAQPDIREEMIMAVEKAQEILQIYSYYQVENASSGLNPASDNNLLTEMDSYFTVSAKTTNPLSDGEHSFTAKMLPPICDPSNSSFTYTVTTTATGITSSLSYSADGMDITSAIPIRTVSFHITCNGFSYEQ